MRLNESRSVYYDPLDDLICIFTGYLNNDPDMLSFVYQNHEDERYIEVHFKVFSRPFLNQFIVYLGEI